MLIETKYSKGDRVVWDSDDCGEILTGTVNEIEITVAATTEIHYWVNCDKEIKSSFSHFLEEEEVFPIHLQSFMEGLKNGNACLNPLS